MMPIYKTCNKNTSTKCSTLDGIPIHYRYFPYQRRECHECFSLRQSEYYLIRKQKMNQKALLNKYDDADYIKIRMMSALIQLYKNHPKSVMKEFKLI